MASSGKDPDEGKVASSSATATTDEVDGGWGGGAPPQGSSKSDDAEPAKSDEPVELVKSPEGAGESEAAPPVEPPPVESPPVESPPVESPPVESPPVETPHVEVESPPAPPPPVESPRAESPPAPPPALLPPVAASVEAREESAPWVAFWNARPSGAWLAVGGGGIVVAFIVGILTGRGAPPEPEAARPAPSSSAPSAPAVVAPAPAPAEPEKAPSAQPSASPAAPKHAAPVFNAKAAKLAIDKIVPGLKTCKQAGEPPGSATVTVTFAPSGRVSDSRVTTTRYAGTRTGNCITQRLRQARIPEFVGSPVTVKRSVSIR